MNLTPLAAAFAGLTLLLASPAAANDNVTLTFAAVKAADGVGTAKLLTGYAKFNTNPSLAEPPVASMPER